MELVTLPQATTREVGCVRRGSLGWRLRSSPSTKLSFVNDEKSPSLINFGIYLKPSLLPASSPSAPSPLLFDNNNNNDNDDDEDSRGETPVIGGGAASNEVEYRFSRSRTNYASDIQRDFNRAFSHGRDNGGEKLKENYDFYGKWNNEFCYESN